MCTAGFTRCPRCDEGSIFFATIRKADHSGPADHLSDPCGRCTGTVRLPAGVRLDGRVVPQRTFDVSGEVLDPESDAVNLDVARVLHQAVRAASRAPYVLGSWAPLEFQHIARAAAKRNESHDLDRAYRAARRVLGNLVA